MKIKLTIDGEIVEQEMSLDLNGLSLQQLVKLEDILGSDKLNQVLDGKVDLIRSPKVLQALIYVIAVFPSHPELGLNEFDIDITQVISSVETADVVELPMTLPDGSEIEGVGGVDPTTAGVG